MKKNNTLLMFGMILSSLPYLLTAQGSSFICGEEAARERLIQQHPEILKMEQGVEEYTQRFIADYRKNQSSRSSLLQNDTIIIPLVFHILEQGGPENIPDAQILDEVRILNRDYNAQNADTADALWNFKPIIGNMQIEWRLANKDPNGDCTNGIDRIYSVQTYYGDDYSKLNTWPRQNYINVWLVSSITVSGGSAAGYAYYPIDVATVYNIPAMDGVIILYSYIGSIDQGSVLTSRALTHEIGHCFNLEHDWGNTNTCGVSCGTCGVPDIPETKGYCSCPTEYLQEYDTTNIEICNPPIRENYQNYMEYSFCSVMFTQGQVARVMAALDTNIAQRNNLYTRANLMLTGTIDTPQTPCAPVAAFFPSTRYACLDGYVTFTDNSTNGTVNTRSWSFPNGNPATSTDSIVKVQFLSAGWQPVSLTVSNSSYPPANTKTDNQLVYVGYSDAQAVAPYYEGFDDTGVFSSASEWASDNYDENQTYFAWSNAAHTGAGSAVLNNYFSTENRDIDEIISPPIDLSQLSDEQMNLSFYYSWASDNSDYNSSTDSIVVYASNNCGVSWLHLWDENSDAVLGYWQGYWVPTDQSGVWQKVNIPLNGSGIYSALHQSNVRFKVRIYSSVGANNFYIDDFNVGFATATGIAETSDVTSAVLFPNPSSGQVTLSLQLAQACKLTVKIFDVTGKEVMDAYEGQMNNGGNQIQLNSTQELANGVYIVAIQAGSSILQKKLVIQ